MSQTERFFFPPPPSSPHHPSPGITVLTLFYRQTKEEQKNKTTQNELLKYKVCSATKKSTKSSLTIFFLFLLVHVTATGPPLHVCPFGFSPKCGQETSADSYPVQPNSVKKYGTSRFVRPVLVLPLVLTRLGTDLCLFASGNPSWPQITRASSYDHPSEQT